VPRRTLERRETIARVFCALARVADPEHRALVRRWVDRWDLREHRAEAAALGYVELGGEGG
jgi:hypothetical protein